MDTSKVKNFIIAVLLTVNLFLLFMVISDSTAAVSARNQAVDDVVSILEANGISVNEDVEFFSGEAGVINLSRDLEEEEKYVSKLLGRVTAESRGGNIYAYQGEEGQAVFRGTGGFEILMDSGAVSTGKNPAQTAKSVLSKLGIDIADGATLVEMDASGLITVTAFCSRQDSRIFDARVKLMFSEESLILVIGDRIFDRTAPAGTASVLDAPTVLMRFLELIQQKGHVCREIVAFEQGYVSNTTLAGEGTLSPVWRVETDTGEYYISGITGKEETVTD